MRYIVPAGIAASLLFFGLAGTANARPLGSTPEDYGYAVTGSTYTSTTADWVMPKITCSTADSYVDIWTGLDGYTSATVEQIGADLVCSGTTATYYAWYELYPSAPVEIAKTVKAGDQLDAAVTYDGSSKFTLSIEDVTQGWTHSTTGTVTGAARSSAETVVTLPSTFTCTKAIPLAAFTDDTVDGTALGSLGPVELNGGDPHILVSAATGKTFSVSCTP